MNRDVFLPVPSAILPHQLAQYEFLGVLIGFSLRSKFTLPLSLSSLFWKQLLDEPIDKSDLESVDRLYIQGLDLLYSINEMHFREWFDTLIFQTSDSAGNDLELIPKGASLKVSYQQRLLFVELALQARLNESRAQCDAVRRGFHRIVPPSLLNLFDWRNVETLVCGSPVIDIDLLKSNTTYQGLSPNSAVVIWFWKALRFFNSNQRQLFLKFVWGRNRLPAAGDWTSAFTLKAAFNLGPDSLPHASTCFFSLDIPQYPSYEILYSKLLYSITHCVAIDADFIPATLSTWTEFS